MYVIDGGGRREEGASRATRLATVNGGKRARCCESETRLKDATLTRLRAKKFNKAKQDTELTQQTHHSAKTVMANTHRCTYCGKTFGSLQGKCSHLAQSKKCQKKWHADLDTTFDIPSHDLLKGCSPSGDNDQPTGMIGENTKLQSLE
jgi:hypothetical protein